MSEQQGIKPYVIGLDLGGTNSVFGIVDSRGDIKTQTAIKTGGYTCAEDFVKASVEALLPIIDQVGGIEKIKAMGIGAPNGNFYRGTIEFAPNLPWAHDGIVPLAQMFSDALGIPVGLTNDANAAALGEMVYGVARTAREMLEKTERPSLLRELDAEKITSLDVSIAAGKGDELAKEIFDFTGTMLGEACADFAAFSSPEAFIFFGGLVKAGKLIMDPIKVAYDNHVMNIFKGKAQFLVSGLDGASAAVLGASAIGWEI